MSERLLTARKLGEAILRRITRGRSAASRSRAAVRRACRPPRRRRLRRRAPLTIGEPALDGLDHDCFGKLGADRHAPRAGAARCAELLYDVDELEAVPPGSVLDTLALLGR